MFALIHVEIFEKLHRQFDRTHTVIRSHLIIVNMAIPITSIFGGIFLPRVQRNISRPRREASFPEHASRLLCSPFPAMQMWHNENIGNYEHAFVLRTIRTISTGGHLDNHDDHSEEYISFLTSFLEKFDSIDSNIVRSTESSSGEF